MCYNLYMFSIVYLLLQLTWALPLNIIGSIITLYVYIKNPKTRISTYENALVVRWNVVGYSMGIGMFIFLSKGSGRRGDSVCVHEYGHTIQSIILGPLYLLVIALPSMIWARTKYFNNYRKKHKLNYNSLYCESWANALGYWATGKKGIDY